MDKLKMQTANKADENFKKLAAMFPNAVTETIDENGEVVRAIDKDVLMQEISVKVVEGKDERYQFTWPDKKKSVLLANAPISKTLRPCREESVDFDTTENLYIEGDNLEVLKLLQETYLGKIKMIYIDPPYNTGHDFVYEDHFSQSTDEYIANSGQLDDEGNRLVQNTENNGRFHTDWLNMIYPRLRLAKDLLASDGVIFISIDDNEYSNLKEVCDEVFGSTCYVASFIWDGGRKNDSKRVSVSHEYILAYSKQVELGYDDPTIWKERKDGIDEIYKVYDQLCITHKDDWYTVSAGLKKWYSSLPDSHPAKTHKHYCNADSTGVYFASDLSGPDDGRKSRPRYEVLHPVTGKPVPVPARGWRWEEPRMRAELLNNRVHFGKDETSIPNGKVYLKENEWQAPSSVFYKDRRSSSNNLKKLLGEKVFDFPKDVSVMQRLISFVCRENDIVLDFFSGSGTIGEAAFQYNVDRKQNIRFILVQLPEETKADGKAAKSGYFNICEIGKERLRRAGVSIKENAGLLAQGKDFGFRVLKCDTSNMKEVFYKPDEVEQTLFDNYANNIKEDRTPEDLLFQVMLDLGVLLSSKIEETTIAGCKVFNVAEGFLYACFDNNISDEVVKAIANEHPYYAVFRDSGMASDFVLTNFDQIFASISPSTVRKVL